MRQRSSSNWKTKAGTWDALNTELVDFEVDYPELFSTAELSPSSVVTANNYKEFNAGSFVSMFVDDYILERFWNNPAKYISRLKNVLAVMSPDYSLLLGMPMPMLAWNMYRNRLVGHVWKSAGIEVVPCVSWADERSFQVCFNGIKKGSCVAISNTGCMNENHKAFFDAGLKEMLKRIEPKIVYLQSTKRLRPFYNLENVVFLDSFFDLKRKKWAGVLDKV
jgi:hypothetical protein